MSPHGRSRQLVMVAVRCNPWGNKVPERRIIAEQMFPYRLPRRKKTIVYKYS